MKSLSQSIEKQIYASAERNKPKVVFPNYNDPAIKRVQGQDERCLTVLSVKMNTGNQLNQQDLNKYAIVLNRASLLDDPNWKRFKLEGTITIEQFMLDMNPKPNVETSVDYLSRLPSKCIPTEAAKQLRLIDTIRISGEKPVKRKRPKVPFFVAETRTLRHSDFGRLSLYASTKELAIEAVVAKFLQIKLCNTKLATELLFNYIKRKIEVMPSILFSTSWEYSPTLNTLTGINSRTSSTLDATGREPTKGTSSKEPAVAAVCPSLRKIFPSENSQNSQHNASNDSGKVLVDSSRKRRLPARDRSLENSIDIRHDNEILKSKARMLQNYLKSAQLREQLDTPIVTLDLFKPVPSNGAAALRELRNYPFVNSIEIKCEKSTAKLENVVEVIINDLYSFKRNSTANASAALCLSLYKAKEIMTIVKSRGHEDVIPFEQKDDIKLLVGLLELKTGLSIDEIAVKFKFDLETKGWRAECAIEGTKCQTKSPHASQSEALNFLLRSYLIDHHSCLLMQY